MALWRDWGLRFGAWSLSEVWNLGFWACFSEATRFQEVPKAPVFVEHGVVRQLGVEKEHVVGPQLRQARFDIVSRQEGGTALFQPSHHVLRLRFGPTMLGIDVDQSAGPPVQPGEEFVRLRIQRVK